MKNYAAGDILEKLQKKTKTKKKSRTDIISKKP